MPLLETKGAGSAQGFGLSLGSAERVYIEDVFSTYLYAGNGSTQTITNGIDLAGEGGLVWLKSRTDTSGGATSHALVDTARGSSKWLSSNAASVESTNVNLVTGFTSSGFSLGNAPYWGNENTIPYVSWTFREQPKFFDIVTYTGTGSARTIAHNLGSAPGCIMVKALTGGASAWNVYHRSLGNTKSVFLNSTTSEQTSSTYWNNTSPTSTVFTVGTDSEVNGSGLQYVAYLFAHDAGGFGLTGLDNVISCGSYTGDGASNGPTVNLGYEPQWILIKSASSYAGNWMLFDNMRGIPTGSADQYLNPNLSAAETTSYADFIDVTSTGFKIKTSNNDINYPGATLIYIAIRRGPMKVPTSGTEVFKPTVLTNTASKTTTNFPVDLSIQSARNTDPGSLVVDRLRSTGGLVTFDANSENGYWGPITGAKFDDNTGVTVDFPVGASSYVNWSFRRAPSFFDEVCYTGTGVARTVAHNLAAVPELMIIKDRSSTNAWSVNAALLGTSGNILNLATTGAAATSSTPYNSTAPTASVFTVGTAGGTNSSGVNYVAYLFATVAGVSKVGSYTGTGTTQVINCGFTAGSRFVMIKRTDSTGDWYVWDSARGIVSGNDPYLLLNSTAAEVTSTDYVDTASTGFEISSTAPAAINANGGTYIFLAIA